MANDDYYGNTSRIANMTTEHAAAVIVIGALVALILLRKGFHGVGIPGVAHVTIGS